jgi:hypothetical protein
MRKDRQLVQIFNDNVKVEFAVKLFQVQCNRELEHQIATLADDLNSIDNLALLGPRKTRRKQDHFVPHLYNLRENAMQMLFGAAGSRMHAIPIIYDENFQAIT